MVEYYKIAQSKAVKEYKKAKKQFERKLTKNIIKTIPKNFYAHARSKSKVKDNVGLLRNSNGKLVSENEEMYNLLNEHFGSVFTSEHSLNDLPEVKWFLGTLFAWLFDCFVGCLLVWFFSCYVLLVVWLFGCLFVW